MMICLLIILSYFLIGTVLWASTKHMFEENKRKHWFTMAVLIWPVITIYFARKEFSNR